MQKSQHNFLLSILRNGFREAVEYVANTQNELFKSWLDFGLSNCLKQGHFDLSKFLLSLRGCKTRKTLYHHGRGFLNDGCESGNVEVVRLLLEQEHVTQSTLNEALEIAGIKGHKPTIDLLIREGASCDYLFEAILKFGASGDHEMIDYFFKYPISVSLKDMCLSSAAQNGHLETVKTCVKCGADVSFHDDEVLRLAVRHNHFEVVQYLISVGANIHAENDKPLRIACEMNHVKLVKYLIEKGADVHCNNEEPLSKSLALGHIEVVKALLENGADINKVHRYLVRLNAEKLQKVATDMKIGAVSGTDATSGNSNDRKRKYFLSSRARCKKVAKSVSTSHICFSDLSSPGSPEICSTGNEKTMDNLTRAMRTLDLASKTFTSKNQEKSTTFTYQTKLDFNFNRE